MVSTLAGHITAKCVPPLPRSDTIAHLLGIMNSDFYGATAEGALAALDQTASIGADVAWQDFAKNSIAYYIPP